ncbi:MAG: hypothetical protein BM565_03405 [Gammaproteobacteria bacterium MedPE]|nr:MAG: hypothetical protein BM565_03405 [Gammaproteobacteria bacterium MedPE]
MKKTHKKIDNQLRQALTNACEEIKDNIEEFAWLTHQVNFEQFPQSLRVSCYFSNSSSLLDATNSGTCAAIGQIIKVHLSKIAITKFDDSKQITFNSED